MQAPGAQQVTVATAFARALHAAGVQRVYGLPGEDHLRLLDALGTEDVSYVGARDETAAVMMAATEAQASGAPGVVLVTIAPGLTNAINGIAHALLDHIPLLVVTGQHQPERAPLIVRQGMQNLQIVSGVTKWQVTASARIHQVLARALDTALAPPAGPVYVELRDDVASLPALDHLSDWAVLQTASTSVHDVAQSVPDAVHTLVSGAARPVVVVGGNCPTSIETREALRAAAATLRAPLFTSPSAMGVACPDDASFAGTFMHGNFEDRVIGASDLILTVGLDAKDFFNSAWRYDAPGVAINAYPDTQRYVPAQHQLLGNTASILTALSAGRLSASCWTVEDVRKYRAHLDAPFHLDDAAAFTIPAALRAARAVLPAETLVAVDAGFGKPLTSYLWSAPEPNQYFTAHGLSTMGFAIPAANALALVRPRHPVVAFMGDGSLLMRAPEITVAVEQGVAPIYVAWMDGALAQIETKQLRQSLRPVGARLPRIRCQQVAEAFGAQGCDVSTLADFRSALQSALHSPLPTLIGCEVDQTNRAEWYDLLRG